MADTATRSLQPVMDVPARWLIEHERKRHFKHAFCGTGDRTSMISRRLQADFVVPQPIENQKSKIKNSAALFCLVVDNYGDIGVCWRLARQLAGEHGLKVRLWVDQLEAFAVLCPDVVPQAETQQIGGVEVCHWRDDFPAVEASDVADVVIEAFACELPASYIAAMARRPVPPTWINLEYLSAETWVEDCHKLPSPSSSLPLTKYFFFPGFTPKTGGLIRERGLLEARAAFDAAAAGKFLNSLGIAPRVGQDLLVSLFCYENPRLPTMLELWAAGEQQIRLLVAPGAAAAQIQKWFGQPFETGDSLQRGNLTAHAQPFLSQDNYDRLLWSCDLNFVRGEDSFVRAQWAQRPFVWQIYPQEDNAHLVKLDAFLIRYLEGCNIETGMTQLWSAWNAESTRPANAQSAWLSVVAHRPHLEKHASLWAARLDRAGDLANNLVCFALALE